MRTSRSANEIQKAVGEVLRCEKGRADEARSTFVLGITLQGVHNPQDTEEALNVMAADHIAAAELKTPMRRLWEDRPVLRKQMVAQSKGMAQMRIDGATVVLPGGCREAPAGIRARERPATPDNELTTAQKGARERETHQRRERWLASQRDKLTAGDELIASAVNAQGKMRLQFLKDGGTIEGKSKAMLKETAMRGWSTWENRVVQEVYRGRSAITPAQMKTEMEQIKAVDAERLGVVPITGRTVREDWPPYLRETAAGVVADARLKNQILVQSIGMTTSTVQFFQTSEFKFWVPENCTWEQWEAIDKMARNVKILGSDAHFTYKHPKLGQALMAKPRDLSAMLETAQVVVNGTRIVHMAIAEGEALRRTTAMLKRRYDNMPTTSVARLRQWFKSDIEKLPRAVSVVKTPNGVWRTHEYQFVLAHNGQYASHIRVIQNLCQGKFAIFEAFEQPQGEDALSTPRSVIVDDQASFVEALSMVRNGILHVRRAPPHKVIAKYADAGREQRLQQFFDESQPASTVEAWREEGAQMIDELSEQEDEYVKSGDEGRRESTKRKRNRARDQHRAEKAQTAEDGLIREQKERMVRTEEEQRARDERVSEQVEMAKDGERWPEMIDLTQDVEPAIGEPGQSVITGGDGEGARQTAGEGAQQTGAAAARAAAVTGLGEIRAALAQPEAEPAQSTTECDHSFCQRKAGGDPTSASWVVGNAEEQRSSELCRECMAEIRRAGAEITAECCEQCSIFSSGAEKDGDVTGTGGDDQGASENEQRADNEVADITQGQQGADAETTSQEATSQVGVRMQEVVRQAIHTADNNQMQNMRLSNAEQGAQVLGLMSAKELYEYRERVAQFRLSEGRAVQVQGVAVEECEGKQTTAAGTARSAATSVPSPVGPPPDEGQQTGHPSGHDQTQNHSMAARLKGMATQGRARATNTPEERSFKRRCPFEACSKLVSTSVARGDGEARACNANHFMRARDEQRKVCAGGGATGIRSEKEKITVK